MSVGLSGLRVNIDSGITVMPLSILPWSSSDLTISDDGQSEANKSDIDFPPKTSDDFFRRMKKNPSEMKITIEALRTDFDLRDHRK